MKYAQLFTESAIVFQDAKGNKETIAFIPQLDDAGAIQSLQSEVNGRGKVTAGALSLMVNLLDNPRFDAYRPGGVHAVNVGERIPKELKAAIREQEDASLKPLFFGYYDAKNPKGAENPKYDSVRAAAWDKFIGALREGGIYGNVKSYSMQYLAYFGMLPCAYVDGHPDKSKLLAVTAMSKAIANAKTDIAKPEDTGLAGQLTAIELALKNRTDKTMLGSTATAVASLRNMLAVFEELADAEAKRATAEVSGATHGDVARMAQAAARKAANEARKSESPKGGKRAPAKSGAKLLDKQTEQV